MPTNGTPTENSTSFEIFDNDRQAKSIVERLSNPIMSFWDITEVNSAMVIGHGVINFSSARSPIGAINSSERFMIHVRVVSCPRSAVRQ